MTNGISRIYLGESSSNSVPDKGKSRCQRSEDRDSKIKTKILKRKFRFGQAAGQEEDGWTGDVSSLNHFNYFRPFPASN